VKSLTPVTCRVCFIGWWIRERVWRWICV